MADNVHVYPIDDLREHSTNDVDCWCIPRIDDSNPNCWVIIHNSADGREKDEENLQ